MNIKNRSKQIIVIRKDLNMRKGKIAAMAAHGSLGVFLSLMKLESSICLPVFGVERENYYISIDMNSALRDWLNGMFTKICCYVNSEEELLELEKKCIEKGIIHNLVVDAGLTEFNGIQTKTCLVIGPDWNEKIDEITGKLKLL